MDPKLVKQPMKTSESFWARLTRYGLALVVGAYIVAIAAHYGQNPAVIWAMLTVLWGLVFLIAIAKREI